MCIRDSCVVVGKYEMRGQRQTQGLTFSEWRTTPGNTNILNVSIWEVIFTSLKYWHICGSNTHARTNYRIAGSIKVNYWSVGCATDTRFKIQTSASSFPHPFLHRIKTFLYNINLSTVHSRTACNVNNQRTGFTVVDNNRVNDSNAWICLLYT